MKFKHLVINIGRDNEPPQNFQESKYRDTIILLDDDVEKEEHKIIAQAISLDIRGGYGFFLKRDRDETNQELKYEWSGNLFHIVAKINENNEEVVEISDLTDEENNFYSVNIHEWEEALLDWKQFYLEALGFLEFDSVALSHMMGVLILTYDQMSDKVCLPEMFTEAMKKCSERYGVSISVMYRDCKKVTGLCDIKTFYCWASALLKNELTQSVLHEFVLSNIDSRYEDIRPFVKNYFNVDLPNDKK